MRGRIAGTMTRRCFLRHAAAGAAVVTARRTFGQVAKPASAAKPYFTTRGVVILPEDLTLRDWPDRAKRAGLTTIALHDGRSALAVARCVESDAGRAFLAACHRLGLEVEYELHALGDLVPRDLFAKDPTLFRQNEKGERTPDANLCVQSKAALDLAAENAAKLATRLRPTTGRYFFWGDDAQPWCRCPKCAALTDSDQALVVENRVLAALRGVDSRARVAHLDAAECRKDAV